VTGFGDIGLYLPPCYDFNAAVLYPVLYLLPGFGGTHREWLDIGIAPLTDQSIRNGDIPPFLIVTTDNTYDAIQQEDIITTLLPYIETHYQVSPDRIHRAIAGGSLGGASAYLLTFQHPDLFANAGIFGNGLITGQEAQDAIWLSAIPEELKPRIFLNSGEQDTFMIQQAKLLIPILDQYKIEHMEIFSAGGHDGRYWLTNFPAFYQWLSEDWQE
jgi:enterochelin esterase-like enzyme